jgi:hypothetical protein
MGDARPLEPTEVAYLRGGQWAATQTALAMLVARGAVVVARLAGHQVIGARLAIAAVLGCAALAMCFLRRRTFSGAVVLRTMRMRCADLAGVNGGSVATGTATIGLQTMGLGVALFGRTALLAFLPSIAADAGLLDGGRWSRRIEPPPPGGRWNRHPF